MKPSTIDFALDARFDESRFPPLADRRNEYLATVARGYPRMSERRVVLVALARDVAWVLPQTIARMERLGSVFREYQVVIYENDSQDTTRQILMAWANSNRRVHVIGEARRDPVNLPIRCLSRAARMASYRAACQQAVRDRFSDYDNAILIDVDLVGGWSYDGIAHTYGEDGWDFVGSYGIIYRRRGWHPNRVLHYDAWAFRQDQQYQPLTTKQVNHMLFQRGMSLQSVSSCFGGLGIYRMPAYLSGRYSGEDIEHVTFHRDLHRQGFTRLFLNPNQITVYGRRHRGWDRWAAWCLQAAARLVRKQSVPWEMMNAR